LDVTTNFPESQIEDSDRPHTHQVPLKGISPHPRKSDLSSTSASLGIDLENLEAIVARQLEREDLSIARAKVMRMRSS
jgi:hypothetical protein